MNALDTQLSTIALDSLATVTGGAGGENGGPASERPRTGLKPWQKVGVGIAAGIGWLGGIASGGGPENVMPERSKPTNVKPPYSITQPKYSLPLL
jgi:hypothetical protein